jgi:glycerol kinase
LIDHANIIIQKQIEHTQIYPQLSWVEHADGCTKKVVIDALKIWRQLVLQTKEKRPSFGTSIIAVIS